MLKVFIYIRYVTMSSRLLLIFIIFIQLSFANVVIHKERLNTDVNPTPSISTVVKENSVIETVEQLPKGEQNDSTSGATNGTIVVPYYGEYVTVCTQTCVDWMFRRYCCQTAVYEAKYTIAGGVVGVLFVVGCICCIACCCCHSNAASTQETRCDSVCTPAVVYATPVYGNNCGGGQGYCNSGRDCQATPCGTVVYY